MTTMGPGTRVWCIKSSPWRALDPDDSLDPGEERPIAGREYVVELVVELEGDPYLKLFGIGDEDPLSPAVYHSKYFRPIDGGPGETLETGKTLENV